MSYKVQYSAEARQDLKDIFNYIAQELLVPDIVCQDCLNQHFPEQNEF